MKEKLFNKTWKKFLIVNLVYILLCSFPAIKIFKMEYDYIKGGFDESYSLTSFIFIAPSIAAILIFIILICLNALIIFDYYNKKGMIKKSEESTPIKITLFEKTMLLTLLLAICVVVQMNIVTIRDYYVYNITALQKDILINSIGVNNINSDILEPDFELKENAIQRRVRNKIVNFHKFKGVETIKEVNDYISESKIKVDNMNYKINKLYYVILGLVTILAAFIIYESTIEEKKRKSNKSGIKEEVI